MSHENFGAIDVTKMRCGVLPRQVLSEMVRNGFIRSERNPTFNQFQPASLDLRLGAQAFRVRASFLAGESHTVKERIAEFCMHSFDLSRDAVLERGCVYIVPLQESLCLPTDIHAAANAKSSTGRLDLLTRLITDRGTEFDRIEAGYHGPLYAEICPRSFSILVREGSTLNQIRFRRGNPTLDDEEIKVLQDVECFVSGSPIIDGGLGFSVDLQHGETVGFQAKPHAGIIDIDRTGAYPVADFWEKIHAKNGRIVLDPASFYILVSKETVRLPPNFAAEMMPYLAMVGEFRVHYAGFFDPGFGFSDEDNELSRAVLEVRCHEVPFVLEHGQQVGRLKVESMTSAPDTLYGVASGSNYQGQRLRLSKHFKSDENIGL